MIQIVHVKQILVLVSTPYEAYICLWYVSRILNGVCVFTTHSPVYVENPTLLWDDRFADHCIIHARRYTINIRNV